MINNDKQTLLLRATQELTNAVSKLKEVHINALRFDTRYPSAPDDKQ